MKNKMKQKMTIETHIEIADHLAIIQEHLRQVFKLLTRHFSNSSPVIKYIFPYLPGNIGNAWGKILNALDLEYHRVVNPDELKMYGDIYYSLQKRFKNMKSNVLNSGKNAH